MKKAKNERTSKAVAKIAGSVLKRIEMARCRTGDSIFGWTPEGEDRAICSVGNLKKLAASCLTQAPDKAKVRNRNAT